jgi:hypothetical protein
MNETKKRGPLHRISGEDASTTEQVFKAASFLMMPEGLTQAKAFGTLVPYIQVLRSRGSTWPQVTTLLKDCGFKLKTSTIRAYYGQFILKYPELCEQRRQEATLLMDSARQKNDATDVFDVVEMISEIAEKKKS